MAAVIETDARVMAISRHGVDKVVSRAREGRPFVLVVQSREGVRRDLARAVIDASGTWSTPNPLGASGLPAIGEAEFRDRIAYGIPDILGRDRDLYAGVKTLVVGSGHSAGNALLELAQLAENDPRASLLWATRSADLARIFSGGDADQLPARGELGANVRDLVDSGRVTLLTGFAIAALRGENDRIIVEGETADGLRRIGPVDRIIAATGQRPDLSLTRELRLDLDPWLESAKALGPLIDPNLHSCGSVPPHGHRELAHPEPGFYTVGIKSYGRAPTFLLLTGYEQVRSVAAAIAGDVTAADDVRLVLPETGVCTTRRVTAAKETAGCCGGPPAKVDACCIADALAKDRGKGRLRMSRSGVNSGDGEIIECKHPEPRRHHLGARSHPNLRLGNELLSSGRARRADRRRYRLVVGLGGGWPVARVADGWPHFPVGRPRHRATRRSSGVSRKRRPPRGRPPGPSPVSLIAGLSDGLAPRRARHGRGPL